MSAADVILLATVGGAIAGGGAGAAVVRLTRHVASADDYLDDELDAEDDGRIDAAATAYAKRIGRPDAADLIRGKLRLGHQVTARRRRGRWSS